MLNSEVHKDYVQSKADDTFDKREWRKQGEGAQDQCSTCLNTTGTCPVDAIGDLFIPLADAAIYHCPW